MGQVATPALYPFERGKPLVAAELNANFLTLLALIEQVLAEARTPPEAVVALEMRFADAAARIAQLEMLSQMHARQRNEREWAPLSHVGALVTQVNDLRRDVTAAAARLEQAQKALTGVHDDLTRRLQRLEQQPEAAEAEKFNVLAEDHERLALKEHMLLAQIIALRHEVSILRELALGHDRQANRMEFAPLSTIGHLLQRIRAIEEKL